MLNTLKTLGEDPSMKTKVSKIANSGTQYTVLYSKFSRNLLANGAYKGSTFEHTLYKTLEGHSIGPKELKPSRAKTSNNKG